MNNSPKASTAQPSKRASASNQPLTTQEDAQLLLRQHLRRLVSADPEAARQALEMSQEQAPELYQIAQSQPTSQWAESLMNSDSMHSLMSRNPSQATTLLEATDLQSLLELLP